MSTNRLVPGMSREEYDRSPGHNFSKLKEMAKSPAHYQHNAHNPQEDTGALRLGRAGHVAVLEPERFRQEFAIWDYGRRAGKDWEAFKAANPGRDILALGELHQCLGIQAAVRAHRDAERYTSGGKPEVSMFWRVPDLAMACKGRVDFIANAGALVDLKTSRDVSPDAFAKSCWQYRYHVQAAFYVDGHEAITGERLPFKVVAVETEAPHVVQVYNVPEDLLELGRAKYRDWLQRLAICLEQEESGAEDAWPGYSTGEMDLTLPRWAAPKLDEDGADDLGLVIGSAAEN